MVINPSLLQRKRSPAAEISSAIEVILCIAAVEPLKFRVPEKSNF